MIYLSRKNKNKSKQSRKLRVKCLLDGELLTGRKVEILAVHRSHPAATHRYRYLYAVALGLQRRSFFMKQTISMFKSSLFELKEVKSLVFSAMLLAISIVLGMYSIQLTPNIKVSFALVPVAIGAILFGPVVGATLGGTADILNFLIKPTGPFFPGFTISAIITGLIYGFILYKKPLSIKRTVLAVGVVTAVVNMLLNTYWLNLLFGTPYVANLIARSPKELLMLFVNSFILYLVTKSLKSTNIF